MDFLLINQDLGIENGDLRLCATDQEALAQRIKTRLKLIKGEWFLDTSIGIQYFTEILGKQISPEYIKYLILNEIKTIYPVKNIKQFNIIFSSDRKITINFTIILESQSNINISEYICI